ncbi:homeobox-leucine zipper protein HAT9-like [Camellia sinensis]|uniref:homeobox-leucine zipper protein HAT9-like n=1 Tax=Camellia sinensis TaxID=4442 RepID=UPI0010357488|nr:homeobox-leucine zipper protein HAT9-like [Camellia sinensis]
MGFDDDLCNNPGLVLGLGFTSSSSAAAVETPSMADNQRPNKLDHHHRLAKKEAISLFEPSLSLGLCGGETYNQIQEANKGCNNESAELLLYRQDSGTSSFSNGSVVKREREVGSEEVEIERVSSRVISDEDDDGGSANGRKKLRLNKDQSALLEESFKLHSTLNPKQKQELARRLNLRPRQVEVWFQNRRARTKLKQTEVDCELLKKCCENLTDENRRLQKELQELKALKLPQPFYMQLPAATLSMCPSCERIGSASAAADTTSKISSPFAMAPKPHFFNPFTNPSAAC